MKRLFLLPVLLLSACTTTQRAIYPPTIEVQSIRLRSLDRSAAGQPVVARVGLKLDITNLNPLPLRLAKVRAELVLDGQTVGEVSIPDVQLPAQGKATQQADLALPLSAATMTAFLNVARGEEVAYRLDGRFTADLGALGQPEFGPFTLSQGLWKQATLRPF